jgi:small subunit ribosomal protein S6
MRNYELVCIVHPDLDETAFNGVLEKVKGWIGEGNGTLTKVDVWGRRRMAYTIRKQREGQYVLFEFQLEPTFSATLDRNIRFLEPVLRHMIISLDE